MPPQFFGQRTNKQRLVLFCRWQHIDYFDDQVTMLPRLMLLDSVYLEMHSVKQGFGMDTFESLNLPQFDEQSWDQCVVAARAVHENRARVYTQALNATAMDEGLSIEESTWYGHEFANDTSVLGVLRAAHPGRNLTAEAYAFDWRTEYPPRVQGPNTYSLAAANWYKDASYDQPAMYDPVFINWFDMHQAADREYNQMIQNGTVALDSRRTLAGRIIGGPRSLAKKIKTPVVHIVLDKSIPRLEISSEVKQVTFELKVTGEFSGISVEFQAEGCLQQILCLTGTMSPKTLPTRHFSVKVVVALKLSNVVGNILKPLPGVVKDPLISIVSTVFDKELGYLEYQYYRSARINEKWERVNVCAPCHILKAGLKLYTGNGFLDLHFRGFIDIAAVYSPRFHASGVWKKNKKDELWGVTDARKHIMFQGMVGFEYRIPGWGYIAGWKIGWETKIFEVNLWDGDTSWWSENDRRSRVGNKLSKAWDYKYGYGNNDHIHQFYL